MMADQRGKLIHINTFEGGQNSDIASEYLPSNQVRYFLNCLVLSTAEGNQGVVTDIEGNTLVATPLPDGENRCIGRKNDEENGRFYFAVWNSLGYHTWYLYSETDNTVSIVLQCITDTGSVDIFGWQSEDEITHIDIYQGKLLYWVNGGATPRKLNIEKCLDKENGYGENLLEEFTRAYKKTATYAPKVSYSTNPAIPYNRLYGNLFQFCTRFIYDDFERSNYSDYSNVDVPENEATQGAINVSTDNNCLDITIETGSSLVTDIEICVRKLDADGGIGNWYQVAVVNKEELNIGSWGTYLYKFYNDVAYVSVDQDKVVRPQSFLPKDPKCQRITKNAIVYANFTEGFPFVLPRVSMQMTYEEIFDETEYVNQQNNPFIGFSRTIWWEQKGWFSWNGFAHTIGTVRIGPDVKKGNVFKIWNNRAHTRPNFSITAEANEDNISIANRFRAMMMQAGYFTNLSSVSIQGGDATFTFDYRHKYNNQASDEPFEVSADPIWYTTLKDNGQSVKTLKMGSTRSFAIRYIDEDGRKSNGYVAEGMQVKIDPVNTHGKLMLPVVNIFINHTPPVWAKYWELLIGEDLTYQDGRFLQFLIQRVYSYVATEGSNTQQEYLDLVLGGLSTYQKIYPNTTLSYQFQKGDRLRLIKSVDGSTQEETYYDFYETEILSYENNSEQVVNDNITLTNTIMVQVSDPVESYKDMTIRIGDTERTITGVLQGHYMLDRPINGTDTFSNYTIINKLGVLRIRKPENITISNNTIVEIFSPSLGMGEYEPYYEFGHKYPVINAGQSNRYHGGNIQDQDATAPARVRVINGMSFVRRRVMPVNNSVKNTQVLTTKIEDPGFSDFYTSDLYDLGRAVPQDQKIGEVKFIDRCRYSNNSIENTEINGFNDFDNLDRVDYNDNSGGIQYLAYSDGKLFVFKELRSGWTPIYGRIIQDQEGQEQIALYDKLLSPNLQTYSYDGGIGKHPESYARTETQQYFISADTSSICRIGGSGVIPISEIFGLDSRVRQILSEASENDAKIHIDYDRKHRAVFVGVSAYDKKVFASPYLQNTWAHMPKFVSEPSSYQIISGPSNGTANIVDGVLQYIPSTDYVGEDSVTYQMVVDGQTFEETVYFDVVPEQNELYYNTTQSRTFWKQCPTGQQGTAVNYVVASGTYASNYSQADANNKAIEDINANGQANANANGTCRTYDILYKTAGEVLGEDTTTPNNTFSDEDTGAISFSLQQRYQDVTGTNYGYLLVREPVENTEKTKISIKSDRGSTTIQDIGVGELVEVTESGGYRFYISTAQIPNRDGQFVSRYVTVKLYIG